MIALTKIPVPVADSHCNSKTAFSGGVGFSTVGRSTTGYDRTTTLCSAGTSNFGVILSAIGLSAGVLQIPQANTQTLSRIHGIHAWRSRTGSGFAGNSGLASAATAFGFQNRSNTTTAPIDASDATMSTSHGP